MSFYSLSKEDRLKLVKSIYQDILSDLSNGKDQKLLKYFSDEDTYIRKSAYQAMGKVYLGNEQLKASTIAKLHALLKLPEEKIRQTVINAAGEIGKTNFEAVEELFDQGLFDSHHSVRNAVIGSMKKMGEKNPKPILSWAKRYLTHEDKEIRREVCHGIELRGRKYPQDVLPLLQKLEHDPTARVHNTLIHVLGQIAYKKGCLQTVVTTLKTWKNKELVSKALDEIIDVHHRYRNFAALSQEEAVAYIGKHYEGVKEGSRNSTHK